MLKCPKCQGGNICYEDSEFVGMKKIYKVDLMGNIRWDTITHVGNIETIKIHSAFVCQDCGTDVKVTKSMFSDKPSKYNEEQLREIFKMSNAK